MFNMAAKNSSSYKLQALVAVLNRYRVVSGGTWRSHQFHHHYLPSSKLGYGGSAGQELRFLSATSRRYSEPKLEIQLSKEVQPPLAAPLKFGFANWVKWLLGSVLSLMLPFWKNKWDKLLILGGRVEKVVEEVEVVAEVVEKVATTADKALEAAANELPDNSKLKEAAQYMEHVSNIVVQDAQLVENIIHKVDDLKQDLEDMETIVEPIVEKIIKIQHPKN
ncbi:hypothetical protein BUALT_Bualt15G0065900 [Buddleja alternifolia]|uniref:Uncharacterized protein n=1 Tax=Buddleja alternifolia TaxID=168488 RepID=A0AAV6WNZ1_9LAMI|nr:hypothetical protein BUALT_Bualt15G0065900 [Buddleja alternifolia]